MMERLTDNTDYCTSWSDCEMPEGKCVFLQNCYDRKIYNKLKEYEDAEEQGLLLRLPVAEGRTVWILCYIYDCKYDYDCVLKSNKNKCEENIPCEHEEKIWRVKGVEFNHKMLKSIGKTVFLTKEEAEAALERMVKDFAQ